MTPLMQLIAALIVFALVAPGSPLQLASGAPSEVGCIRLEHEWNGGAQRYRAFVLGSAPTPAVWDESCPPRSGSTFHLDAPKCVSIDLGLWSHSHLNGAPPYPTDIRLYVVPADHPTRHGGLGRDAWLVDPVLSGMQEGPAQACLPTGDHRLIVRACRYAPTPMHPASVPQCDGVFIYDVNTDDGGRTNPLFSVTYG